MSFIKNHLIELSRRTIVNVEAARWITVGVIATGLHYGIYFMLLRWLGLSYNGAYAGGYAGSLVFNYIASVKWAFRTDFGWLKTLKFLASHGINCTLHFLFLNLFIWIGISELIAPVLVLCLVVPINFLLVRLALKNTFLYDDEKNRSSHPLLQRGDHHPQSGQ